MTETDFISRPLITPAEELQPAEGSFVLLMHCIEGIDREIGVPYGRFFP